MTTMIFNKMKEFNEETGLSTINKSHIDISWIYNLQSEDWWTCEIDNLEVVMMRINAYIIYLESIRSSLQGMGVVLKNKYESLLYDEISQIEDSRYLSKEEKISMAHKINAELDRTLEKKQLNELKLFKTKDMPYRLSNFLESLKLIYKRRVNERRSSIS